MSILNPSTTQPLEAALHAFDKTLDRPDIATLKKSLRSTNSSELLAFLQTLDDTRRPSLNLIATLSPILQVFDRTYNIGRALGILDSDLLQCVFGCIRCTLLVGQNKHKDMATITKLLEEVGRIIQPKEQTEGAENAELWDSFSRITNEVIRACTVFITDGSAAASQWFLMTTMSQIRHIQDAARQQRSIEGLHDRLQKQEATYLADRTDDSRQKIYRWLAAPDSSSNHNSACKKRQSTTGVWFLDGPEFSDWKETPISLLWLHGIPGCGKTILWLVLHPDKTYRDVLLTLIYSSTIIQDISRRCLSDSSLAVAYFYFDFNDSEKQRHDGLLRSLITQFCTQATNTPNALKEIFSRSQDGRQQPTSDSLVTTLRDMLQNFCEVFIILDALDECKEREELLGLIEEIIGWKLGKVHILTTSRRLRDIEVVLDPLTTACICIQSALVDADIRVYIRDRLQNDPKLKKWPEKVQNEIEVTLMKGAHGMFRWVACQLDELRKCIKLDKLRRALVSLPKTLDDTYEQILCNIDEEYSMDALKIMQWLVFSGRPLRIDEVAEVIAVNLEDDPHFDPENRLPEPRDILTICASLVTITTNRIWNFNDMEQEIEELRLAHFSVQEYLTSERIKTGEASRYSVESWAHRDIAKTCLIYLLQFGKPGCLTENTTKEFPLALYAAEYWTEHARKAETAAGSKIEYLSIAKSFLSQSNTFANWIRLFNQDHPYLGSNIQMSVAEMAPPLYYVSRAGLFEETRLLLEAGAVVNARGGKDGNALQAAAWRGYESVVQLLLEKGADVNAQDGDYGNALQAAASRGHESVVQLLLEKYANVNAQGGNYGNTLQAAAWGGHESLVQLLLENGAEVNAQGGKYGNALQAAALGGHESVAQLLLENGVDVNAQGGRYGNALQAATWRGHESVVQLLLENGADVNAQGGYYGNALQAAAWGGHESLVQMLLGKGADVNAQGGYYGSALQAAAGRRHEEVAQLLLEKGADVNAQGGKYGNALQAAAPGGHESLVQMLLEKGAKVNAQGGYYGNALQAAALGGHESVVQLLLENGADVNAQGGEYGNALQAAAWSGHEEVVRLLLEKGADANAEGGEYGNALQAAATGGFDKVVQLLLENGADVNAQGGDYGNALQAAVSKGRESVVQLLLKKGADFNTLET